MKKSQYRENIKNIFKNNFGTKNQFIGLES